MAQKPMKTLKSVAPTQAPDGPRAADKKVSINHVAKKPGENGKAVVDRNNPALQEGLRQREDARAKGQIVAYYAPFHASEMTTNLCLLGASNEDLEGFFGVGDQTVDGWYKKHPEFRAAVDAGRELADAAIAAALFKRATGQCIKITRKSGFTAKGEFAEVYEEELPPDPAAAIWLLTSRMKGSRFRMNNAENAGNQSNVDIKIVGGLPEAQLTINQSDLEHSPELFEAVIKTVAKK